MLKSLAIAFLFGLFLLQAGAHEDHANLRHWEKASADPDRIFLSFHGDPASSRAVTWRTDTSVGSAQAQIAIAAPGPEFAENPRTVEARTERIDLNIFEENKQGAVNYHSVIFEDLQPDTLYAYRVGTDVHWSEWIQFRTAKADPAPFSFVYFGDAQNDLLSYWSRLIRMSYEKAPEASFSIHAGDLVNNGHRDLQWAEWFEAGGWIHSQRTGIPVLGNHELRPIPGVSEKGLVSILWRPQFTLPEVPGLPEELQETVYTVDYQGVRIIVLNSMRHAEEQIPWLRAQLERPGAQWTIITSHYSMFSARPNRQDVHSTNLWQPVLEEYDVDLVLQGHDHYYMRGHVPVRNTDGEPGDAFNTLYVTSVSGPKQYKIDPATRESLAERGYREDKQGENMQFFQVIEVDGNTISYTAYTATGEVYDRATIVKDPQTGQKTLR
jgi:3',5'-cyclic AMP phosphodiesterase CpdA